MNLWQETWDAFTNPINDGWGQLVTHIELSVVSLAIAAVIGITLGLVSAKVGKIASFLVVAVANLGRTVPEFAIMALAVALSSIGFWPAVVGLAALGVPPILLNVYTGITGVDRNVIGAARGMGMTAPQITTKIEFPIAIPTVFVGLRVAAVQIVATAALAGLVGAGGLGVLVLSGLTTNQDPVLLAGAIPIALLAMSAQLIFVAGQRLATPRGLRLEQADPSQQKG